MSACLGALDALEQLLRALPRVERKMLDNAADRIHDLLRKAQILVLEARGARQRGESVSKTVAGVDTEDYTNLWLYAAMNDFEFKLEELTGKFMYSSGIVVWGKAAESWPKPCKDAIKDSKTKNTLKSIVTARHWLYHSTSEGPDNFETLIRSMGKVLCSLAGIKEFSNPKGLASGRQ